MGRGPSIALVALAAWAAWAACSASAATAGAQLQGSSCLAADPPPLSAPPRPLRFGITSQIAGSAGATQSRPRRRTRARRSRPCCVCARPAATSSCA